MYLQFREMSEKERYELTTAAVMAQKKAADADETIGALKKEIETLEIDVASTKSSLASVQNELTSTQAILIEVSNKKTLHPNMFC